MKVATLLVTEEISPLKLMPFFFVQSLVTNVSQANKAVQVIQLRASLTRVPAGVSSRCFHFHWWMHVLTSNTFLGVNMRFLILVTPSGMLNSVYMNSRREGRSSYLFFFVFLSERGSKTSEFVASKL